jgi:HEAT repeat protein
VLLNAAAESDVDIARPAKATLTRMEGKTVDAALLSKLPQSSGTMRQSIIELAALRRVNAALPAIVSSVEDSDPGIRRAALNSLSTLGSEQQVGDLVRLLSKKQDSAERDAIEKALTAICGRTGTKSLSQVLPLAKNSDSELRKIALRSLATMGGPDALAAVKTAVDDRDESVQDEAVGTLATWPNNWPDDGTVAEPLLSLVKSGQKRLHQVQGARGYLLYVQENKKLSNADKVKVINDLLPLLKQPPEKRLAISALAGIPTAKSIESLVALAGDQTVTEEACLAIVNVATAKNLERMSKEARQKALQTVLDKSQNDSTRKKAGDALKAVP